VLAPDQDVSVVIAHAADRTRGPPDHAIGRLISEIITLPMPRFYQLPSRNPPEHVAVPQPPSRLHCPTDPRGAAQNDRGNLVMCMFDTPNLFSPRSDILAFPRRSEDYWTARSGEKRRRQPGRHWRGKTLGRR